MSTSETDAIRERYERRKTQVETDRYSPLRPDVWQTIHERQRVILRLFAKLGMASFADTKLLEVGCGAGGNLLEFLRLGFQPQNLIGIELLEDRVAQANKNLPTGMVRLGDATTADIPPASQDIVFQSTVFSSLLDDAFQQRLATKMWSWVRAGGQRSKVRGQRSEVGSPRSEVGILWYDFVYNNPNNPDVRGVPVRRVRELFPESTSPEGLRRPGGEFIVKRVTLAPPIARRVCRIHPSLYNLFNAFPFLRTHVLCWIGKNGGRGQRTEIRGQRSVSRPVID